MNSHCRPIADTSKAALNTRPPIQVTPCFFVCKHSLHNTQHIHTHTYTRMPRPRTHTRFAPPGDIHVRVLPGALRKDRRDTGRLILRSLAGLLSGGHGICRGVRRVDRQGRLLILVAGFMLLVAGRVEAACTASTCCEVAIPLLDAATTKITSSTCSQGTYKTCSNALTPAPDEDGS